MCPQARLKVVCGFSPCFKQNIFCYLKDICVTCKPQESYILPHKDCLGCVSRNSIQTFLKNFKYNIENHNNLPQAPVSCRDDVRGAQNFKIGRALGKLLWISINSGLTMVFHNNLPTSCHKLSEQGWRGLYIRQIIVNNQI